MRLKVANGEIMGGRSGEAELGSEFSEHDRSGRPDQAKRLMLQGKFDEADVPDWHIIKRYDLMVSNQAGALPHCATVIREANDRLSLLSPHHAPHGSQWTGDEEEKIVRAVKATGIKSNGSDAEHLQKYDLSREAYQRTMEAFGMQIPLTAVFASNEAPALQKCARYWHKGDTAWDKHWGAQGWGHLYLHGAQRDSEQIVNKMIADGAKKSLGADRTQLRGCPWRSFEIHDRFRCLEEICVRAR